jgi:hypothetical protein
MLKKNTEQRVRRCIIETIAMCCAAKTGVQSTRSNGLDQVAGKINDCLAGNL